MIYFKHLSCLASLAAVATVVSALPAHAEIAEVETDATIEAVADDSLAAESVADTEAVLEADGVDVEAATLEDAVVNVEAPELDTEAVEDDLDNASASASALLSDPTQVSFQLNEESLLSFNQAGLQSALTTTTETLTEGVELAQASRRGYGAVSPAYLGVAGNLGFGDPDSAIGDFAFNVISKISLGPRFSLRPGFFISERYTNFAIPLTYNFNTLRARNVVFQPYLGAGVDVPFNGNTALMLNAGADVPISRAFTLNGAANFRVTSGFGVGFSLGVGYNFPFIFE